MRVLLRQAELLVTVRDPQRELLRRAWLQIEAALCRRSRRRHDGGLVLALEAAVLQLSGGVGRAFGQRAELVDDEAPEGIVRRCEAASIDEQIVARVAVDVGTYAEMVVRLDGGVAETGRHRLHEVLRQRGIGPRSCFRRSLKRGVTGFVSDDSE